MVAIALAALTQPAIAQRRDAPEPYMRSGEPETLKPPAPPTDGNIQIIDDFRTAYSKAGFPKMTIFWNRQFTDDVQTRFEDYTSYEGRKSASGKASGEQFETRDGIGAAADAQADFSASAEIRSGRESVTNNRTETQLTAMADLQTEQAFQNAFRGIGVHLIDRTSIMRTTGAKTNDKDNAQQIEIEALLANSNIVLEVTQYADPESATGVMYRVIARSIRSARVMIDISTSAQPPSVYRPYIAGSHGFVRAPEAQARPHDIGRQLAIDTMSQLVRDLK